MKQINVKLLTIAACVVAASADAQGTNGGLRWLPPLVTAPILTCSATNYALEGHPIKVMYTLKLRNTDTDGSSTPGRLVISHRNNSVSVPVPKLTQGGRPFTGSISLLAGRAGTEDIDVKYYKQERVDEFVRDGAQLTSERIPLSVAARFFVSLDRMHVFETRSASRDDNFITLGCQLGNGTPLTAPPTDAEKPMYMRNTAGGDHRIDLSVGPIDFVPGSTNERLAVSFAIVNLGYVGSSAQKGKEVANAFSTMVSGGLGAAFGSSGQSGSSSGAWASLAGGTKDLHEVWDGHGEGADGEIANEKRAISMNLLDDLTFPTGSHEFPIDCKGVAPHTITANPNPSHYRVFLKVHRQATVYKVNVTTGDVPDAGTDSHVFITIRGERGSTEEQELDNIQQNFQQGGVEQFTVTGRDVGRITGIRIRHDNTFNRKVWFLKQVTVENMFANEHAIFNYNNWLALDRGPRTIDVELARN